MADPEFDDLSKRSPSPAVFRPNIKPSSPPPDTSPPKHMPSTANNHEDGGIQKICGDETLIGSLTGGDLEMMRLASEQGLPPDRDDGDDKDEPQVEDASLLRSQPTKNLKRLSDDAFELLETEDSHIGRSIRRKIVYQSDDETGDGHPNGGLLTSSSKSFPQVFYTDDTSPPGEVS